MLDFAKTAGSRRARVGAVLFPLMLWLFATFFLLGDIGKYNDDWYYVQRDPASGAIQSLLLDRPVHFWRPLYRVVVPALLTLLSEFDRLNHLIVAGTHAVVALLLWRLLRELNVSRLGAATAALWFIVWPSSFEAVFWLCALPTALSAAMVVTAWILTVRFARGAAGPGAAFAVPLFFFAGACLNEQAACGLAAIPFLYMAARPHDEPLKRSLARAAAPTAGAFLLLGVYLLLHVKLEFKPPALGHDSVVIPLGEMPRQAAVVSGWLRGQFLSGGFLGRLFEVGARTLLDHPARAALFGVLLLGSLPMWARSMARTDDQPRARAPWLIAAGIAGFLATLAPIVALNYWLVPRITYAPSMGIALLIAGIFSLIAPRQLPEGVRVRAAAPVLIGLILMGVAVMMIAPQRGYQERAERDASEAAQLRQLLPSPDPGAVFAPLRIAPPPVPRGGAARFDTYYASALSSWWSAGWFLRMEYKRSDLDCGYISGGTPGITHVHQDRASVYGVGDVPWDRVVPFVIDEDGKVHLVTQVRSGAVAASAPQTVRAAEELGLAQREFVLP